MKPVRMSIVVSVSLLAFLLSGGTQLAAQEATDTDTLLEAARQGDLATVQRLIEADAALLSATDDRSCAALHFAVNGGHVEVAEYLLAAGADIEARDVDGDTPLHWAACNEHTGVVDLLAGRGAELNAHNHHDCTPLMYSVQRRQFEMVEYLLELGADIEARNDYGRTPLIWATREGGNIRMIKLLLHHGADVDALDRFEDSSLSLAAWRGFRTLVGILLDAGARTDLSPGMEDELLQQATERGLDRLYKIVVEGGAEVDVTPGVWTSALHIAAAGGSAYIVKDFIDRGADVMAKDMYGWNPLHCAASRGRLDVVKILLGSDIPIDAPTISGMTALSLAKRRGAGDVVALLKKKGAKKEQKFPKLTGAYLGQGKPPAAPEPFAPDIVATCNGEHGSISFTPDGRQAFWSGSTDTPDSGYTFSNVMTSRVVDGRWTAPQVASFMDEHRGDVPFAAPDGRRLFFMSTRPLVEGEGRTKENIWVVERQGDDWGDPYPLPPCVNSMPQHWQISVASSGNLYFNSRTGAEETQGVYMSREVNGEYTTPEFLGFTGSSPYIAPDESFLMTFDFTEYDRTIVLRFKRTDGRWGAPIPVGATYPDIGGICPNLSPDGKALFFIHHRAGPNNNFWVDAGFLDELRAQWDGQ